MRNKPSLILLQQLQLILLQSHNRCPAGTTTERRTTSLANTSFVERNAEEEWLTMSENYKQGL